MSTGGRGETTHLYTGLVAFFRVLGSECLWFVQSLPKDARAEAFVIAADEHL